MKSQRKLATQMMSDLTKALKAEVSPNAPQSGIHPLYKSRKRQINVAFRALRKAGYVAEQNYWCCSSCGLAAGEKEARETGKRAIAFYHTQDLEGFKETGEVYIRFARFIDDDPTALKLTGQEVAAAMEAVGLTVSWYGDPSTAILVA